VLAQAEAERERRARVIAADGEFQASAKLAQVAKAMGDTPGALQLRLLQTVVDVAAEKNGTLVMPFPVELLRFFDQAGADTSHNSDTATTAAPRRGTLTNGASRTADSRLASVDVANAQLVPPQG